MAHRGFFAPSRLMQSGPAKFTTAKCELCNLYKGCKSPKMPFSGEGRKGILIVGEAPGADEDEKGSQFVGKAGSVLRSALRGIGIDLDRDCWKTNALICRPPQNATPKRDQLSFCRPNLFDTIKKCDPRVIILLGLPATQQMVGDLWKDKIGTMVRWAGHKIRSRTPNAWICPTWHPSYLARQEDNEVLHLVWRRHLREAVELEGRPWDEIRDYAKEVKCIFDPEEAARLLDRVAESGGPFAFDYETNSLKPETKGAAIASASVSWRGQRTFSYLWLGPAVDATSRLLRGPAAKVFSNAKFEDRWTRVHLGHPIRNIAWDTMLLAHHADNRSNITSIKFQSFIHLGMAGYNSHIEPFLKGVKGSKLNRIFTHIDKRDLLTYNGLDSLLEYLVAERQLERLGRKLE